MKSYMKLGRLCEYIYTRLLGTNYLNTVFFFPYAHFGNLNERSSG